LIGPLGETGSHADRWCTTQFMSHLRSALYRLPFSVTTYRLILANQNETGRAYLMLRVAHFPFHRQRRTGGYNPHVAENARNKQVRRDRHTMGLEKVNSRLTYSSKADVRRQLAKTEMPSLAKVHKPLLVESYIRL
jgi:hypothetical protein